MDIFKNIFKHKVNIQDVFGALENFSGDIKTLSAVRDTATAFFGDGWRFNMEMYIASLPQNYRAKYYDIFRQVLEYERAVNVWTRATQIVNGARPITADVLKNISEYRRYLLRFGVEGQRLYTRLSSLLDMKQQSSQNDVAVFINPTTTVEQNVVDTTNDDVANVVVNSEPESKEEPAVEDRFDDEPEQDSETSSDNKDDSVADENSAYRQQLKNKIMQRVREISNRHSNANTSTSTNDVADTHTEIENDISAQSEPINISIHKPVQSETSASPVVENGASDTNEWNLENFVRMHKFLELASFIMPAITLYKNAPSIEEYQYYGFIIDAIDYALAQGERVLSLYSDTQIRKYFSGGKSELEDVLISYRHLRDDQISLMPDDSSVKPSLEKSVDDTEPAYVRPDNS